MGPQDANTAARRRIDRARRRSVHVVVALATTALAMQSVVFRAKKQ
jgi:hypothetical protein